MKYKVVYPFADLHDDSHIYRVGDEFPREGVMVKKERYEELASANNKIGRPLIVAAENEPVAPEVVEIPKSEEKPVKKASSAKKRTK